MLRSVSFKFRKLWRIKLKIFFFLILGDIDLVKDLTFDVIVENALSSL